MTTALLPSSPVDLRHACVNVVQVHTFLQYVRPARSGRATRRRALAREVGGAWDARPTRKLSPRCAGAGVAGVVLLFENWLIVVRHSSGTARTEALLAAFTRRRVDRDRRGDALAHARRRRAAHVWVVLAASLKQDVARCGASLLLLSPVVVLVSRLLFGRRFVRSGPSPACIATGDARAMRAPRVRHGWFSPPQSSTDVARVVLSSPLFFSRSVAPRAALPRSTRMPAGGARITSGRAAHATRAATRAAYGESERRAPSELAVRVLRACGALLLSSLVPSLRARPSLDPPTRRRGRAHHERARGACDARRDARGAWESERRAPSEFAVRVRGNGRPGLPWGFPLLRARSCSVRSAPRDRRRAGRAHHERARDARGARCGARGVRGRQGKSAFLCRGSRFARVLCLSLLSSLRAALLPRSPPRRRARASGHTTHPRSERRVGAALRVCLWFVCASFRDLARRAARSCALVLRKT